MRAVSEAFDYHEVPVPEVFGWRIDGKETFIYMSLIDGSRLSEAWPTLTEDNKTAICTQLRGIVACLRKMKQSQLQGPDAPPSPFIGMPTLETSVCVSRGLNLHLGSILGTEVQDIFFHHRSDAGPFHSVAEFNDGVQARALPNLSKEERAARDPYRSHFPDSCGICFTHGDIHLDNIIVEKASESPRIVGLIDWGLAGWYPEYWEYCKAAYTSSFAGEWRNKWIPIFLEPRIEVHETVMSYTMAMGAM